MRSLSPFGNFDGLKATPFDETDIDDPREPTVMTGPIMIGLVRVAEVTKVVTFLVLIGVSADVLVTAAKATPDAMV